MLISEAELCANQIPLDARGCCAHLLVVLGRCQRKNYYMPWTCMHEKHLYEACLVQEYTTRLVFSPTSHANDTFIGSIIRRRKLAMKQEEEEQNSKPADLR